ncbi:hypothetical protein ACIA8K_16435 [Catenuloplanes sp. NPDC051500]|uniref:hypothetical protein n=1 Tax=Catenuloplanes sp. NPDC051500 TaxID=3363959 RepID=UPI00379E2CCA
MAEQRPDHRPILWLRTDHDHRADFTVEELADNCGYLVTGICPGCGGRIRRIWPYGSGSGYKGIFNKRAHPKPPPGPRLLRCNCGNVHGERPAEETLIGCGAYWTVELQ